MVFWKKFFNFFGTTCNGFRLSCRVVKEGNEGKCEANAQGEKGETRRGERREWEGQAARQAAAPLSTFLSSFRVCPPCLSSSRCTRCSERATSLARSPTTGLLPMCEEKCIAGTGLDPYRGAKAMRAFLAFRSFFFSLVGNASRWIRVNAVRLTLIHRRFDGIRFLFERHHRSSMLNLSIRRFSVYWLYSPTIISPRCQPCSIVKSASW